MTTEPSNTTESRTRKMTEKGFQYRKETLEERSAKLRKQIDSTVQAITTHDREHEETQLQQKLETLHEEFKDVSLQLIDMGCKQHSKFLMEVNENIRTLHSNEDDGEEISINPETSSNTKVQEENNGLRLLDQMTSSINEGPATETEEETAFNQLLTKLRSNLQKFDDDLAQGDNEAIKLDSANISSDLNALIQKKF